MISFFNLRANFCAWLNSHGMFNTLALAGAVNFKLDENIPIAAVGYHNKTIHVIINPCVLAFPEEVQYFIISHELRHVFQLRDFSLAMELFDWTPLGDVDKTTGYFRKLAHTVFNFGGDIALNQDVAKLLSNYSKGYNGDSAAVVELVRETIIAHSIATDPTVRREDIAGILMPDTLRELAKKKGIDIEVYDDMCYTYYGNTYIELMKDEMSKACESALEMEKFIKDIAENGFDQHNFGEGADGEGGEIVISAAAQKAIEKALNESQRLSRQAGKGASDATTVVTGKQEVLSHMKKFIKKLKVTVGVANVQKFGFRKTYNRRNRKFPYESTITGKKRVDIQTPSVILVIDTSGSMYDVDVLRGMVGFGQELEKQNKLAALYCCDTELHKVEGNLRNLKLIGGGGTVFDNDIVNQLLEENNVDKATIIYLTDEYVYGLDEVKKNNNVKLIVVNVPEGFKVRSENA